MCKERVVHRNGGGQKIMGTIETLSSQHASGNMAEGVVNISLVGNSVALRCQTIRANGRYYAGARQTPCTTGILIGSCYEDFHRVSRRQNVGRMGKGFVDSKYKVTKMLPFDWWDPTSPSCLARARALRTQSGGDGAQSGLQVEAEVTLSFASTIPFEHTYWPDHGMNESDAFGYNP
ncbi:hypothetical protein BDN71DRAFT_262368 [Pleurotus eryngii]|uniref:Uncharacterized protein n=1 Tax=Pleurotus eryngii TaxID=5323 RepID=A0A9P6DBU6_PLEER|nr:hypothetical protein BDN71DRAFT_262368 [Pleurotus eryngii]